MARSAKRSRLHPAWVVAAVAVVLLAVAIWLLRTRVPEDFEAGEPEPVGQALAPQTAFEFFYGSPDLTGLRREVRFLPRTGDFRKDAPAVMQALFSGSLEGNLSPWPKQSKVEGLFLTKEGILLVELNKAVRRARGGDFGEWVLAASLTRTLCANFPEVSGVRIEVGGQSTGPLLHEMSLEWTYTASMFEER